MLFRYTEVNTRRNANEYPWKARNRNGPERGVGTVF